MLLESGLYELIPDEFILADKAYIACPKCICPFKGKPEELSDHQNFVNKTINRHRIIVEHANSRIKQWGCMKSLWRHNLEKHKIVFQVCCQLSNIKFLKS